MSTRDYIGDGVYVDYDGWGITLRANDYDFPTDTIYIELSVLRALNNFARRVGMEGGD